MAWLRNNVLVGVLAGIMTTAVISAVAGVWAIPMRLGAVEDTALDNREHHDRDVFEIRARHRTDLDGVAARQAAAERVDDTVVQMLETVQRQIVSVQHLVEAQIAFDVRQQGREARQGDRP